MAITGAWISRYHWRKTILLGMVILNFTVVHMVFLPEGRYRLPVVPFILAFAAITIYQAVNYFIDSEISPEIFRDPGLFN